MTTMNMMSCTPSKAKAICLSVAKMPPGMRPAVMLHGVPGSAKSSIVQDVSQELFGKPALIQHIAMMQSVDLRGLPFVGEDRETTVWLKPAWFPTGEAEEGVLLLDEFTQGDRDTLGACYSLLLDRALDGRALSPGYVVIATGNDVADGAIANDLGSALRDRLLHIHVKVDDESFLDHHAARGLHPAVLATIAQMPHLLSNHEETLSRDEMVGMTPRAWERAGRVLAAQEGQGLPDSLIEVTMSGILGTSGAMQLMATRAYVAECASAREVMAASRAALPGLLPKTARGAMALAFTLPGIADDVQSLAKCCLAMSMLGESLQKSGKQEGMRLNGREVATYAIERVLLRAEGLKLRDDLLTADVKLPGVKELFAHLEAVDGRIKSLRGGKR